MSASGPYRFVGAVPGGGQFVERPELTRRITDLWKQPGRPGNLSLFGHRRVGKTSLLTHALGLLDPTRRPDLAVVRLTMGSQDSLYGLLAAMTRGVAEGFPATPELTELCEPVREARGWFDLSSALAAFFREVGRRNLNVLVALDDFDRAPRVLPEVSAFQLLRSLASEPGYPVGLLTVSRRPVIEIETDAAGGSYLDGVIAQRAYVGLFTAAEAGALVDRARSAGVDLSAALPELTAHSGLHPYLLGLLCRAVVERYRETGVIDVAGAAAGEAAGFRAHFGRLLEAVDADSAGRGRDLLRAIAADGRLPAASQDLQQLTDLGVVVRNGDDLRLFSPAFAAYVLDPDRGRPARPEAGPHRCTALVVATEWDSAHGGLSTFNRLLCTALARQGVRVFCMVLAATAEEVAGAARHGVTLLVRTPVAGAPEHTRLFRRPDLPDGVLPDLVVGHGRITGPAALMLAEDHFPSAKKLHFVHMDPDEIEWHKPDRQDDAIHNAESRGQIELALGRAADRLVAVGPRLHGRFLGSLSRHEDQEPLRFDPGFDLADPRPRKVPGGAPVTVLLTGRAEDAELKGLDLAARACGLVAGWRHEAQLRRIELVVRGVPERGSAEQLAKLAAWAGNARLNIVARHYTTDAQSLADDLGRASLVVMPSRAEGFGLVGLEALVAGTPVLVSSESGLGELLKEALGAEAAGRCVVPMSGDTAKDVETWARAVDRVLGGSDLEFARAQAVREDLAARLTWAGSADRLLAALGL